MAVIIASGLFLNTLGQSKNYLRNKIIVEGLYIRNLGNFSSVWSTASGGYVGYSIAFPEHNLLIFRTGLISNKLRDGVDYEDATNTIVPIEIGGRYYFINDTFMPFIQFMNGLNLFIQNTDLEGDKEDKTMVKYAWQIGFGVTVNLMSNFSIDVGANYQSNFYFYEAMNTGFEYTFGIGYALGE